MVSGDFAEKWPDAHVLVENLHLTNAEQNAMILQIDQEGAALEEVVAQWLEKNVDTWTTWVEEARAARG
jgi:glycine betaine/proline transport system substrate-binding protein